MHGGGITGKTLFLRKRSIIMIKTGSDSLDALLGGGIQTRSINGFFGDYLAGTQLAHTLCITAQQGGGEVIYISTIRTEVLIDADLELLEAIAFRFKREVIKTLEKISVFYTSKETLDATLTRLSSQLLGRTKLLVVDLVLSDDFPSEEHYILLSKMMQYFNIAIVLVSVSESDASKPAGVAIRRLLFSKANEDDQRVCRLLDSPNQEEVVIKIGSGIADI